MTTKTEELTSHQIAQRMIQLKRHLDKFEADFESIGVDIGQADTLIALDNGLSELILDVLGIPPDTTMRPDCRKALTVLDCNDGESVAYANLPADFYCRDWANELLYKVVDGDMTFEEMIADMLKEES